MEKLTQYQTQLNSSLSLILSQAPNLVKPLSILLVSLLIIYLIYQLIRLIIIIVQNNGKYIIFELQPLKHNEQSSFSTEQLFTIIHGLARQRSWVNKLFDIAKQYSFEIVSSKEGGIVYYARIPENDSDLVKKTLLSYLPGISVKECSDYLSRINAKYQKVSSYKLSNSFVYTIKHQLSLDDHDPIAYVTGSMTKLTDNDMVAFQVLISPLRKSSIPEISKLSRLIYEGKASTEGVSHLISKNELGSLIQAMVMIILRILMLPIGLMVFILTDGKEGPFLTFPGTSPSRKLSTPFQSGLELQIKEKLDQQLFRSSLRLMVASNNLSELKQRERGFISALSSLSNGDYQSIVPAGKLLIPFSRIIEYLFTKRLLLPFTKIVLSASEISDIYHFPYSKTSSTENLLVQHSKELPAPLSLKQKPKLDIYFATNSYGGAETRIGMTEDERRRHVYILGATGTGKSTMLLSMIKQDIEHNKGLCVIDPHGDLIEQILQVIPRERIKDVVYFNPDDISYPIGINLLELTPGLSSEDAIREKEFIAESIISLFHKIYGEKYSGPRMEYILRNTIHTVFTVPGATLFTINKILIDPIFRKSVVRNLTDENLLDFWKYEFAQAGDYQKINMILPITNKIGRFLFSPTAKRILEQPKSTINFDEIMNDGKILICNLSKGKIGEDNSEVLGILIMAKIQLSALKRSRMTPESRKDFYLYVDEFQNFATESFAQILSEARKYKLCAVLAHQTTSQIEEAQLVNVTLANTGTVICFRTANPQDEKMIIPQFSPYIESGEIASLPSYHFYMRLGALNPEEPFSGVTTPVHIEHSQNRVNEIIKSSRKLYTIEWHDKPGLTLKVPKIVVKNKEVNGVSNNKYMP